MRAHTKTALAAAVAAGSTVILSLTGVSAAIASPASGTPPPPSGANSITWVSPSRGWVLGQWACAKGGTRVCTQVLGTVNAGKTWKRLATLPVTISAARPGGIFIGGISEIKFANASDGWVYGPYPTMYRTVNGGKTWTARPVPGGGKQMYDIAATATGFYGLTSACTSDITATCEARGLSLWRTGLTGAGWTKLDHTLPFNVSGGAYLTALGKTVYVIDGDMKTLGKGLFLVSTDSGARFAARTSPCSTGSPEFSEMTQAVPQNATTVFMLCVGNPGKSMSMQSVYESSNNGKTDHFDGQLTSPGIAPFAWGIQAQLAVSPAGNLAVAASSDGTFMYIKDSGAKNWKMLFGWAEVASPGWNDLAWVSGTQAWAVYSPVQTPVPLGQLFHATKAFAHYHTLRPGARSRGSDLGPGT
jgi:photosystem II stability/assembly factor-like uncharacterized protein